MINIAHNRGKCLNPRNQSGMSPRQPVTIFSPNAFPATGVARQEYKTRKRNTANSALYEGSTLTPTFQIESCLVDFQKVSQRRIQMPKFHHRAAALYSAISARMVTP